MKITSQNDNSNFRERNNVYEASLHNYRNGIHSKCKDTVGIGHHPDVLLLSMDR